jgi:hypothetical protein
VGTLLNKLGEEEGVHAGQRQVPEATLTWGEVLGGVEGGSPERQSMS